MIIKKIGVNVRSRLIHALNHIIKTLVNMGVKFNTMDYTSVYGTSTQYFDHD